MCRNGGARKEWKHEDWIEYYTGNEKWWPKAIVQWRVGIWHVSREKERIPAFISQSCANETRPGILRQTQVWGKCVQLHKKESTGEIDDQRSSIVWLVRIYIDRKRNQTTLQHSCFCKLQPSRYPTTYFVWDLPWIGDRWIWSADESNRCVSKHSRQKYGARRFDARVHPHVRLLQQ